MPILFVVSALSTGLSLTVLLAHFFEKHQAHEAQVSKVHLWLVSTEIIVLIAFFALIYSGSQGAVAKVSANLLLTGSLALPFWLLLVIVGLIGPLVIYVQQSRSRSAENQNILLLTDGAVIVSGLTLRCLIVFAALPVWNGLL